MEPPPIDDGWIGAVSAVLVAAIGAISVWLTSRSSKKALRTQESIEESVVSVETLVDTIRGYEQRLRTGEQMLRDLTDRSARTERELGERVAKTERDLDAVHGWKRAAIRYIKALREHAMRHSPAEPMPPPPEELLDDLRED